MFVNFVIQVGFIGNKFSYKITTFNNILAVITMPLPNFMSKAPNVRPPAR
jgi:hypothetical protein